MEIELKLLLLPADVAAFRRLELLKQYAVDKPYSRKLSSTCFDTPELHLQAHGMELRVRRAGRAWIQTLKAGGHAVAGLHRRQEWEVRVAGPQADLSALAALVERGSEGERVLSEPALAQGLVPIFDSVFTRTVWPLRLPGGAEVELALDQGELRCGDARAPISEVEFELKAGAPGALLDFALQLQDLVPLRAGNLGKAARGYALRAPHPLLAVKTLDVKARPVDLDRGMTVEQGFGCIASNCLAQIQDNELGVLCGTDPESVHQMRVGMRRLRSALGLFARWIPFPQVLRGELGWLGGELGAARDADVLADGTLATLAEACAVETELLRLREAASVTARAKRQQAAAAVGSARYSRLMLGLLAWLQGSRWQALLDESARKALAGPLNKRAAWILARRHKKLLDSGRRLDDGTPEERHRVRIAAKKARYATEFFQSLYRARRINRYIKRLTALQDALGRLNDATVADRMLRELERHHLELAGAASFARGFLCAAAMQDVHRLASLWRQFSAMEPL